MAVITISRQFGAGGKTLGQMLADELGYTFADSEIVTKIAQAANVSETWVENVEKEAGGKLSRVISSMVNKSLVDKVLKDERGYIDEQIYLDYLIVMIAQIAEEGNAVILGRGSQYILRGHPDVVHVLLINEFENRVKFMMDRYDMSYSKAASPSEARTSAGPTCIAGSERPTSMRRTCTTWFSTCRYRYGYGQGHGPRPGENQNRKTSVNHACCPGLTVKTLGKKVSPSLFPSRTSFPPRSQTSEQFCHAFEKPGQGGGLRIARDDLPTSSSGVSTSMRTFLKSL